MSNKAHVAILTDHHLFRGILDMKQQRRVSDLLNNKNADVVELGNVKRYRFSDLEEPDQVLASIYLRKAHAHIIAILKEDVTEHDAQFLRMEKAKAPGNLYVGEFHVQGTIVFAGTRKEQRDQLRVTDWFIPVEKAIITLTQQPDIRIPARVAMINNETLIGYHYEEEAMRVPAE